MGLKTMTNFKTEKQDYGMEINTVMKEQVKQMVQKTMNNFRTKECEK